MTSTIVPNGSEIAGDLLTTSDKSAHITTPVQNTGDLLAILEQKPPRSFAMLKTTCGILGTYLNLPGDQVPFDLIEARRGGFRQFLSGRTYTENSVRTFVNQLNILLKTARKLGWDPENDVSEEWKVLLALAAERKVRDIVRHFSLIIRTPGEVTVEAVQQWGESKIREGMQYATVVSKKSSFWKLLQRTGLTTVTPPNQIRQEKYGIPLDQMAPKLRAEIQALLKWKQAEFAPSRPKSGKIRAISAESLSLIIGQLAGYVINVCGIQPSSFADLVQKHHVEGFVEWVINERGMKGRSIKTRIGMIAAVVKSHPAYASQDYSWFKPLADSIPIEDDSEQKKRKAPRYLEYEVLEAITVQIRTARDAAYKKKRFELAAWLAMEYLMLSWLLILPWRQRNIRECRVGGENPNVFKRKIGPYSDLDKPAWVIEAEARNPDTEFWQIYFSPAETKTGVEVHTLLPRQLIEPLERYLSSFVRSCSMGSSRRICSSITTACHSPRRLSGQSSESGP